MTSTPGSKFFKKPCLKKNLFLKNLVVLVLVSRHGLREVEVGAVLDLEIRVARFSNQKSQFG
jgi:hypothetical protein